MAKNEKEEIGNETSEQRLERLKELSELLTKRYIKNDVSIEKFKWLTSHLKDAISAAKSGKCDKENLLEKLEDLICVVDVEEEIEEECSDE